MTVDKQDYDFWVKKKTFKSLHGKLKKKKWQEGGIFVYRIFFFHLKKTINIIKLHTNSKNEYMSTVIQFTYFYYSQSCTESTTSVSRLKL